MRATPVSFAVATTMCTSRMALVASTSHRITKRGPHPSRGSSYSATTPGSPLKVRTS
jgi:hypothetical protein